MYSAEISRANPTCFVFLLDQSRSMEDRIGGDGDGQGKEHVVADAINRLLQELAIKCAKEEGVRDYFYVSVIGYGKTVEINHGNGYVTRYAHNQRVLVAVGDTVQKGQPIALIGSTGGSTGPHLHFEVLKQGRAVDPMSFVRQ